MQGVPSHVNLQLIYIDFQDKLSVLVKPPEK